MDIKRFQEEVKQLSQKLDTRTPERRFLYLISELGEVVDEVLDLLNAGPQTPPEDIDAIKERLGLELYDVIWNAVDLANLLEIDLETAFQQKNAYNDTRTWSRSGVLDEEDKT